MINAVTYTPLGLEESLLQIIGKLDFAYCVQHSVFALPSK